eukprot:1570066-Rhodomonas_salina.1
MNAGIAGYAFDPTTQSANLVAAWDFDPALPVLPPPPPPPEPLLYPWPPVVVDVSGNGHDGVFTGASETPYVASGGDCMCEGNDNCPADSPVCSVTVSDPAGVCGPCTQSGTADCLAHDGSSCVVDVDSSDKGQCVPPVCAAEEYLNASGSCESCTGPCAEGSYETTACTVASDRTCAVCPVGHYCADGLNVSCIVEEGFYCPEGWAPGTSARRQGGDPAAEGVSCPASFYCAGGSADKETCTAAGGFYCPVQFAPGAASVAEGRAGKACPPALFCAGDMAQPQPLPPVCDLVQACGGALAANETCSVAQSTFHKYNDPPT